MKYEFWSSNVRDLLDRDGSFDFMSLSREWLRNAYDVGFSPEDVLDELEAKEDVYSFVAVPEDHSARTAPSGRQFEGFDKFIDDILIKESRSPSVKTMQDSPLRQRAARHQDRPANRTIIRGR